jgi:hypothetical protein
MPAPGSLGERCSVDDCPCSRPTQIFLGQAHVFVVPQEELLAPMRHYVRQQRDYGSPEPAIVPNGW